MIFFIGVIILTALLVIAIVLLDIGQSYINLASVFIIISIVVPLLFASGLFKSFVRGIQIVTSKNSKFTDKELNDAIISMTLVIKLIIISGLICFLVGIIAILAKLNDMTNVGMYLSMSLCSILYSLFGIAFLLPSKAKLQSLMSK